MICPECLTCNVERIWKAPAKFQPFHKLRQRRFRIRWRWRCLSCGRMFFTIEIPDLLTLRRMLERMKAKVKGDGAALDALLNRKAREVIEENPRHVSEGTPGQQVEGRNEAHD